MTDQDRADHYRVQRDRALADVAAWERGGVRFYEAHGNEPMRDVTAERLAKKRHHADMFDRLGKTWDRLANGLGY